MQIEIRWKDQKDVEGLVSKNLDNTKPCKTLIRLIFLNQTNAFVSRTHGNVKKKVEGLSKSLALPW
jgi:hypothetical protein